MIAESLKQKLEQVVGPLRKVGSVGGGSISSAFRLHLDDRDAFLKVQLSAPEGFFEAEAAGLRELGSASLSLRVPGVIATGRVGSEAFIVMEWLDQKRLIDHSQRLGAALAGLHRQRRRGWGCSLDGFIGSLPQANSFVDSWSGFWLARRLEPQLRRLTTPVGSAAEWAELERVLPELLSAADEEGPSLLHGDLWSGNVLSTDRGPALVDPACYQGHREVDLAMAELFGGFDDTFFGSYCDAWPLLPGYEARKGVYQLYYLLVHVNLFGASYVSRTHHTLRRVLTQA